MALSADVGNNKPTRGNFRMDKTTSLIHDGYAMVRRPLLSIDELDHLYKTLDEKKGLTPGQCIELLLADTKITHAMRLGSPGLLSRLSDQSKDEASYSLLKYAIRMSTRCTPYAAFASVGIAHVADHARISTTDPECRIELDCDVLNTLHDQLLQKATLTDATVLRKNPASYTVGTEMRFFERSTVKHKFHFALARATASEFLMRAIEALSTPKPMDAVVGALAKLDPTIPRDEIAQYVGDLVHANILQVNIDIAVIGKKPLKRYLDQVRESAIHGTSGSALSQLGEIASIVYAKEAYSLQECYERITAVEQRLKESDVDFIPGNVVHVDSFLTSSKFHLHDEVTGDLATAIRRLNALFPQMENRDLKTFAQKFERRFGNNFIPLGAALDPELGVPFGHSEPIIPWIEGLAIAPKQQFTAARDHALHAIVSTQLRSEDTEIDLAEIDLQLPPGALAPFESFCANLTLYAADQKDNAADRPVRAYLHYLVGPGSGNLITRFAARNEEMSAEVAKSIARDEACLPGAVFAEICHLPNPRANNVLRRPSIRKHELVLTGTPSVDDDQQIRLDELLVGCFDGQIILWSSKINKRIIPCSTSAYNFYSPSNVGLYQFLCRLARQAGTVPGFAWPSQYANFPRLPRVRCGSVIVELARWRLGGEAAAEISEAARQRDLAAIQAVLHGSGLPRYFTIDRADQKLEFDSQSLHSMLLLGAEVATLPVVFLRESAARIGSPLCSGEDRGSFHTEFVLPLHMAPTPNAMGATPCEQLYVRHAQAYRPSPVQSVGAAEARRWVYLKVYGGEEYLCRLLRDVIADALVSDGRVDKWYFVRFYDPDFHIRLRIYGSNAVISSVASELWDLFEQRRKMHEICAIQMEAYIPEENRYGGASGIQFAESIFHADSMFCLAVQRAVERSGTDDHVWRSVLLGTVQYIELFTPSRSQIAAVVRRQRDGFKAEMVVGKWQLEQLGKKYKEVRQFCEDAVDRRASVDADVASALEARGMAIQRTIAGANHSGVLLSFDHLPEACSGIIHMQCNRLFTSPSRAQEFVVWEFLDRAHRSVTARKARHAA